MSSPSATPPAARRLGLAGSALVTLWIVGLLLRLVVGDSVPYLSALYYGLPWPVLAGLAVLIAAWCIRRRQTSRAGLWCVLGIACLIGGALQHVSLNRYRSLEDPLRVVFWNASRGAGGWEHVARTMQQTDADIIGLVEAGAHSPEMRALWQTAFPEHKVSLLGGGFVLITRGEASDCTPTEFGNLGESRIVDVTVRGQPARIVLVDVDSNPMLSREPTLVALARQLQADADRPTIVMGDFNTPHESRHFSLLRQQWRNAFEVAGKGYYATWPTWCPVLALDQIWVSRDVTIGACGLGWTSTSDHRPVLLTCRTTPAAAQTDSRSTSTADSSTESGDSETTPASTPSALPSDSLETRNE